MPPPAPDRYVPLLVKMKMTSTVVRQLLVKEHKSKEVILSRPAGRTLLVLNVPPLIEEVHLSNMFESYGKIKSVQIQPTVSDLPQTKYEKFFSEPERADAYRVAYVVFHSDGIVKKVLQSRSTDPHVLSLPFTNFKLVSGLKRWQIVYNRSIIDVNELQKEIDLYMSEYDKTVEENKKRNKELDNVPDDEGWTKVTRQGKRKSNPNTEYADKMILEQVEAKQNKKIKNAALPDFYSFQRKEAKFNKMVELRKQFAEDKKKIVAMKASRNFKPV